MVGNQPWRGHGRHHRRRTPAAARAGGYAGGPGRPRSESTLGHLVANALRDTLSPRTRRRRHRRRQPRRPARRAVLRRRHATSPENTDGVDHLRRGQLVLPFVNNLCDRDAHGRAVQDVLEQQWQRDADGAVPSRGYLELGLSKNVKVRVDHADDRTLDGSHVTSVMVNGKPLDMAKTYKVADVLLPRGGR